MIMERRGPNDPCYCGSGKKYKKCCLGKEETGAADSGPGNISDEIRQALEGREFSSLEEANTFLGKVMASGNKGPLDDFHGLSPEEMHCFLHLPFTSQNLVTFSDCLSTAPEAPIIMLFDLLARAIGENGLKATAKGNLPREFCRDASLKYWEKEVYAQRTMHDDIRREEEFIPMHKTRLVAEMAGLVCKYRGRFLLTRKGRDLLSKQGLRGIYPQLLRAFVEKFNWAYSDGYPSLGIIQQSFLYTLYLLDRYGGKPLHQEFYENSFLKAFPGVVREVEGNAYSTAEETVRRCYTHRTLESFARFLGLVKLEPVAGKKEFMEDYLVTSLPLLEQVVKFHVKEI